MQITALEEYGVRCALQLARAHSTVRGAPGAKPQAPLSASRIAELEGLSVEYVSKIMHLFRKAGIVSAARGNTGGFYLAHTPTELSLHQVFQALLGKKQRETICTKFPGQKTVCAHNGECSLRPVWSVLAGYFDEVLKKLTLGDLMLRERETESRVSVLAADHARRMTHLIQRTPNEKTV